MLVVWREGRGSGYRTKYRGQDRVEGFRAVYGDKVEYRDED
jgi:hypothetical protein